jgi:hypothetical protein
MAQAKLDRIEMDTSIQCRAAIDTAVVTEYAERMKAGDVFPPVTLFGDADCRMYIGDGWHRIMAARQNGAVVIEADIRKGGRSDALKHALGANASNGLRRSNADKRRCVEIALKEFAKLSDNAIATLCGVDNHTVKAARPNNLGNSQVEKRIGLDGKERPATRNPSTIAQDAPDADPLPDTGEEDADAPCTETGGKEWKQKKKETKRPVGLEYAMNAIDSLKRIPLSDPMRPAGFAEVAKFIKHEMKGIKQ